MNDRKKETVMEEKLRLKPSPQDVNDNIELRMHLHVDVSILLQDAKGRYLILLMSSGSTKGSPLSWMRLSISPLLTAENHGISLEGQDFHSTEVQCVEWYILYRLHHSVVDGEFAEGLSKLVVNYRQMTRYINRDIRETQDNKSTSGKQALFRLGFSL